MLVEYIKPPWYDVTVHIEETNKEMKKLLLTLILAAVSSSAKAEWVEIGTTNKSTVYADPTTIRKLGNKVKMWALWDYLTAPEGDSKPHMSVRIQNEYNCKEETSRQIYATTFSGNMAEGNTINRQGGREWQPVAPRTFGETLWKFACGK